MAPKSRDEIHAYWQEQAGRELDDDGLRPTARDPNLQAVVEAGVERHLQPDATVLDVGCGDGSSTLRFARRVRRIVGVDYVAGYVERARMSATAAAVGNATFVLGDGTDLAPIRSAHGLFDIAVTIRCLINLSTWEDQRHAITEIANCLRPGGLYLASEGWREGRDGLNRRRVRAGLAAMDLVDHNLLISRHDFESAATDHFTLVGYEAAGIYLFISRVVQPLLTAPEEPSISNPLNRVGAALQLQDGTSDTFADCDYAGVYVLARREFPAPSA